MTPLAAAAMITAVFVWNQRMAAPLPGLPPETATSAPAASPPAASPSPSPGSPVTTPAAPVPVMPSASTARPRPPAATTVELASTTHAGVTSSVVLERRAANRLRLRVVLRNRSGAAVPVGFDRDASSLSAGGKRAGVVADSAGTRPGAAFAATLDAGASLRYWMEFERVDDRSRSFEVVLAPPAQPAVAGFAPFSIALDAR
jgi:hypothetical protein